MVVVVVGERRRRRRLGVGARRRFRSEIDNYGESLLLAFFAGDFAEVYGM
jgi:hypothetical protein